MSLPSHHGLRPVRHTVEHGMFVRDYPGDGAAPWLVFVHGLGESGLCFERIVEHPKLRGWHCSIPDLPGYGRSGWQDTVGTLADLADRLTAWVLSAARTRAPVLVGHSMGGIVALLAAERNEHASCGVVDVDGNKSLGDCTFSARAAGMTLDAFVGGGFDAMVDDIGKKGAGDTAHRGYYASLRLCDPRAYHAHATELLTLSRSEHLAKRLAALTIPTRYLAGRPGGACARSMHLLRQAGVLTVAVEPAGHWPFIDQPDAFADALVSSS